MLAILAGVVLGILSTKLYLRNPFAVRFRLQYESAPQSQVPNGDRLFQNGYYSPDFTPALAFFREMTTPRSRWGIF